MKSQRAVWDKFALVTILVFAVIPVVLITAAPAQALPTGATFTVNSPADVPDATPGNTVCETANGNGVCTLRAAIQEANALAGADIINIGTITVTLTRRATTTRRSTVIWTSAAR